MRLPLIAGKSGDKRRGIEAIVGTWGDGVHEVPVLELRGVILIECLHTLILKIENRGVVVHISGWVHTKIMVDDCRGMIVQ